MSEAGQLGPSEAGSVLVDVGGDHGALVIVAPAGMAAVELEISADHDHGRGQDHPGHDHRTHVAVRERRGPGGVRFAAIFPSLLAGDYTIWAPEGPAHRTVTVAGGEVTQVSWDDPELLAH